MASSSQFPEIVRHQWQAPVNVLAIASDLGIKVYKKDLGTNVSGILKKDAFSGFSGFSCYVHSNHHPNRQRFTVAHEIAHYLLHRREVDDGIVEDEFYRALSNPKEREANEFAAEILMPWSLINSLDANVVKSLNQLAASLGVSQQAMAIRLGLPYDQYWD